jgi:hypothetical protein
MPVVFRYQGFKFFFYSNEGSPREPMHIHVIAAEGEAKIWISPIGIAESNGFDAKTQRRLLTIVREKRELIERKWHEYFS